jgi:translocation protein SEC62
MKENGFYGFDIYKPQTKMTFLAIGLAIAIIAIILFPLWPYSVKLGIFNCLFYFTASFLGMTVARLLIWIALFSFGIDFWIFPNLFDDDAGLIESFVPVLLINRRDDSWLVFALRLVMIASFAGYCYTQAGFPLPLDSSFEIYNDVFEWGKDKMVGNETTSLQYAGNHRPTLEDILKATEDYEKEEQEEKERLEQEAQENKDQAESEEANEDL